MLLSADQTTHHRTPRDEDSPIPLVITTAPSTLTLHQRLHSPSCTATATGTRLRNHKRDRPDRKHPIQTLSTVQLPSPHRPWHEKQVRPLLPCQNSSRGCLLPNLSTRSSTSSLFFPRATALERLNDASWLHTTPDRPPRRLQAAVLWILKRAVDGVHSATPHPNPIVAWL